MVSEDLRNLAKTLGEKLSADSLTLGDIARAINIIATASHDVRALENAAVVEAARLTDPDLPANVVRIAAVLARKGVGVGAPAKPGGTAA